MGWRQRSNYICTLPMRARQNMYNTGFGLGWFFAGWVYIQVSDGPVVVVWHMAGFGWTWYDGFG